MELYKVLRPTKFKDVIGQPAAVATLTAFVKNGNVPHAVMLSGPTGTGKTTLARVLLSKIGVAEPDLSELNCATIDKPLTRIREIEKFMNLSPLAGDSRGYILDEVQSFSRARFTQEALLKVLEDPPAHAYFVLCTTDPHKIIDTVKGRCDEVKLRPLSRKDLELIVARGLAHLKATFSDELIEAIVEASEGSARKALVLVEQVVGIPDNEGRLAAVTAADAKTKGIDLCRALVNPRVKWPEVAAILKGIEDEPEGVRRHVIAYAATVVLGGGKLAGPCAAVIEMFRDNLFDTGKAGLVLAAWQFLEMVKRK